MRTLTLKELGRKIEGKEWDINTKNEFESLGALIGMEKATGYYEEDIDEINFSAGNRLKDGFSSFRITESMIRKITEEEGTYTISFKNILDDVEIEITEWEPLLVQKDRRIDVEEFLEVLEDTFKKNGEFFLHLNSGNLEDKQNEGIELSNAHFTEYKLLASGELLAFSNANREPISYKKDGTPLYSIDGNTSLYIQMEKIAYIEEAKDTEDWFSIPIKKMLQIHMNIEVEDEKENIVTVGILY